jgi:hypothetical protein
MTIGRIGEKRILFPGEVAYVWSAGLRSRQLSKVEAAGPVFEIRAQIIWAKDRGSLLGEGELSLSARAVLVCGPKGREGHWKATRRQIHGVGDRAPRNPKPATAPRSLSSA